MNPRIAVMAGPLRGQVFPLGDEPVSIGREGANSIAINDRAVSRRHCVIRPEQGAFRLQDLQSHNGTFVNGIPAGDRILEDGDEVRVGESLFLIQLRDSGESVSGSIVELRGDDHLTHSEIRLRWEDSLYLKPKTVATDPPATARLKRHLDTLIGMSTALNSIQRLEPLQQRLLELVFETIPADRGAIFLGPQPDGSYASVFGLEPRPGTEPAVQVSRPIIERVLREGTGTLSSDIEPNPQASGRDGSAGVHSILCVPLPVFDSVIGVLYLDTSDPSARLGEDDLQFMTAVGRLAAFALENARRFEWLESENRRLRESVTLDHDMVGESPRMREVYGVISKAAPRDSTVLILGESGTGKELAAQALHRGSPRSSGPFVPINCAALTETLLESELFGHEKGAFTGAIAQKRGKIELADGGTLFLDEMGELVPVLQAKLLRVLQSHELERVGGTRAIKVNVRVIAATNKDLNEAMRAGTFRQDLYYRLNVVSLTMPPLRERREDIPLLISYFINKYAKKCARRVVGASPEARALLVDYDWPGNVRELENAIERAIVLGSTELILPEDLPESVMEAEPSLGRPRARYHEAINQLKKEIILRAVEETKGNLTEAARSLGLHPNYLHRLIRNMNLKGALKGRSS